MQFANQDLSDAVVAIRVFLRGNTVLFRVVPQFFLDHDREKGYVEITVILENHHVNRLYCAAIFAVNDGQGAY